MGKGFFALALLLRADDLRVLFGTRTIFSIDTIEIADGDRIGLVGENGAGKSTLLSVLHGDREPDAGRVKCFAQSAMIRQFGEVDEQGHDEAVFARLGAFSQAHEGISGGEMMRLRVAAALSAHVPLIYADEPTNNLDFDGIQKMRQALQSHRGALVLVSHDRALLDDLCETIWELEDGALHIYSGNYSAYRAQKEQERDRKRFEYEQYRSEQARLRSAVVSVREASSSVRKAPKRMGNSEARLHKRGGGVSAKKRLDQTASALQSRLQNLDAKDRPREETAIRMGLTGRGGVISQTAVRAEALTLAAGGRTLLSGASFSIPTGRRTALIGPNGCGKTTLLRAIRAGARGITAGPGVTIGWFGQETIDTLNASKTLLENVMEESVLPVHEARTLMARMGLSAADMEKQAGVLSGGERAKAALARLMAGDSTLLLLDEPGNHLDILALEALEEMLSAYAGTLLLVSHDRRMLERVAQRLLVFDGKGGLASYEGDFEAYEASRTAKPTNDLSEDILRMRMTALLARMGAPKKGETRELLEAEYAAMEEQLRQIRGLPAR